MEDKIKLARTLVQQSCLGESLHIMKGYIRQEDALSMETLQGIENDYSRMLDYMRRGFHDDRRTEFYNDLLQRMYRLIADIETRERYFRIDVYAQARGVVGRLNTSPDFVRSVLEGFVADAALLSLEEENTREEKTKDLYERHYVFMNRLFNAIWTSCEWSRSDRDSFSELLLSPMIDSNDVKLLVSAVTLGLLNQFDPNKFLTLTDVYQGASDERIRQRAFVGWAFTLPEELRIFPELTSRIRELLGDGQTQRALLELQIQVFYCLNAEKDNQKIQRDIMPTLLKNQQFNVTRFGITEKEEDPMQDILYPDAVDKTMEEMEQSIRRMMDMQKAGSDIYFSGFSQMKRFPFFSSMSNWFCPFFIQHPGLNRLATKVRNSRFMQMLLDHGPFCDSDKYSFALAMESFIDKLPANMREILNNEEAFGPVHSEKEHTSPVYIRRMYLQDLYRFYKVFPKRTQLSNPFEFIFFCSESIQTDELEDAKLELGKFLVKQSRWTELARLLTRIRPTSADYFLLEAYSNVHEFQYEIAIINFHHAIALEPDNESALKGLARFSLLCESYEEADEYYTKLLLRHPESKNYALNRAIALLNLSETEKAMTLLYKLVYEYPDDSNVKRVYAWGLLCMSKFEQALKEYQQLLGGDSAQSEDWLNAGYCNWLQGYIEAAIEYFRKYNENIDEESIGNSLADKFSDDWHLLHVNGITDIDVKLMVDAVTW